MKYKPHQITGGDFLAKRGVGLLADEPRVGKTASALRACNLVRPEFVVITCPAHLRMQWVKEVEAWRKGPWVAAVVSYNKLPDLVKRLRTYNLVPDAVIGDEIHYCKERSAARSKAFWGLTCNRIGGITEGVKNVFVLTGTPQPNSPLELWPMLRALAPDLIPDPKRQGRPYTYSSWKQKFCKLQPTPFGVKIIGGKNLKLLESIMSKFSMRRTRVEVFGRDVQPASITFVKAEGSAAKELGALMNSPAGRKVAEIMKGGGGLKELAKVQREGEVGSVRRLVGLVKVPGVCKIIAQELDDEPRKKIVVFCFHHDVIDATRQALQKYSPLAIDGRVSPRRKEQNKAAFQDKRSKNRVIICQIEAAKVGYDLSAANDTVFMEQSWVGDDNEQAMSRIFNMNKDEPCFTRFAVLAGSVDEDIVKEAARKVNDSGKVFKNERLNIKASGVREAGARRARENTPLSRNLVSRKPVQQVRSGARASAR